MMAERSEQHCEKIVKSGKTEESGAENEKGKRCHDRGRIMRYSSRGAKFPRRDSAPAKDSGLRRLTGPMNKAFPAISCTDLVNHAFHHEKKI